MSFEDLKDKFTNDARMTWERIQESSTYNQLRDRYDNLSPMGQKVVIASSVALLVLLTLSFPYSHYTQSQDYISDFEGKRMTIRELLKVSRESSEVPQIPQAPPVDMIRSNIEGQIKSANLLPEQIKSTEVIDGNSKAIPKSLSEGAVQISLAKLNLRQVLDLGYQFQSINPSVKMTDLTITANREDTRYFDVVYKLVALAVPSAPEIPAEPPAKGRGSKKIRDNPEEE